MVDTSKTLIWVIITTFMVGTLAGCASSEQSPTAVPITPTDSIASSSAVEDIQDALERDTQLEEILERSRLAMADVASYKTNGTQEWNYSTEGFTEPNTHYREFGGIDNNRSVSEYPGGEFTEFRMVGNQFFNRTSSHGWVEAAKPRTEPVAATNADHPFDELFSDENIRLVSDHERTQDGTAVFRLEAIEEYESSQNGDYQSGTRHTSILIDKITYRLVTVIIDDKKTTYEEFAVVDITPATNSSWYQTIWTDHYYDYNVPVTVEAPEDYVGWAEQEPVAVQR